MVYIRIQTLGFGLFSWQRLYSTNVLRLKKIFFAKKKQYCNSPLLTLNFSWITDFRITGEKIFLNVDADAILETVEEVNSLEKK